MPSGWTLNLRSIHLSKKSFDNYTGSEVYLHLFDNLTVTSGGELGGLVMFGAGTGGPLVGSPCILQFSDRLHGIVRVWRAANHAGMRHLGSDEIEHAWIS